MLNDVNNGESTIKEITWHVRNERQIVASMKKTEEDMLKELEDDAGINSEGGKGLPPRRAVASAGLTSKTRKRPKFL